MGRKKVKATWSIIVRAIKAGDQSCNILLICDKIVLKCLFSYLIHPQPVLCGILMEFCAIRDNTSL